MRRNSAQKDSLAPTAVLAQRHVDAQLEILSLLDDLENLAAVIDLFSFVIFSIHMGDQPGPGRRRPCESAGA